MSAFGGATVSLQANFSAEAGLAPMQYVNDGADVPVAVPENVAGACGVRIHVQGTCEAPLA